MALDPERLRKTCAYESQSPVESLAADLAQIESLAARWRRARRRLLIAGILTVLAGVAGHFLLPPFGLILIAVGIGLWFWMKRYPKSVANGAARCEFSKIVAGMLARDADPKDAASLRLTFNPPQEVLTETALPQRRNGKQKVYKLSWFSLETGLLDGTTLTGTVEDVVRQRSFTNPRGKSKSKTRTRHLLAMRFAYPDDVYGDLTQFAAKMQKEMQLPPSASMRGLEVNARAVKVKALVTQSGDLARTCTMLALGVYRMLNLARRLRARRARAKRGGTE